MSNLRLVDSLKTSNLLVVFGILGILWSVGVTIPIVNSFEFSISVMDIILFTFISIPIILMLAAFVSILTRRFVNTVFWLTSVYWLFISVGEMVEGYPYSPNFISIVIIAILTILLITAKLIYNTRPEVDSKRKKSCSLHI